MDQNSNNMNDLPEEINPNDQENNSIPVPDEFKDLFNPIDFAEEPQAAEAEIPIPDEFRDLFASTPAPESAEEEIPIPDEFKDLFPSAAAKQESTEEEIPIPDEFRDLFAQAYSADSSHLSTSSESNVSDDDTQPLLASMQDKAQTLLEEIHKTNNDGFSISDGIKRLQEFLPMLRMEVEVAAKKLEQLTSSESNIIVTLEEVQNIISSNLLLRSIDEGEDERREVVSSAPSIPQTHEEEKILKRLQEEISSAEAMKYNAELRASELIRKAAEAEEKYHNLLNEHKSALERLSTVRTELSEFESKREASKKQERKLSESVAYLEKRKRDLDEKVNREEHEREKLLGSIAESRTLEVELRRRVDDLSRKVTVAENKGFEIREQRIVTERELSEALFSFTDDIRRSKETLLKLKKELNEVSEDLTQRDKKLADITAELEAREEAYAQLVQRMADFNSTNRNLEERENFLNDNVIRLTERENRIKQSIENLEREVTGFRNKKEQINEQLRSLLAKGEADLLRLSKVKQDELQELTLLRNEAAGLQLSIEQYSQDLMQLKEESASTEVEKKQYEEKIAKLISNERTYSESVTQLVKKQTELESEVTALQEKLQEQYLREEAKKLAMLTEQRRREEENIGVLKDEIIKLNDELSQMITKKETTENKLKELQKYESVLQGRLDYYRREIDKNKSILNKMIEEMDVHAGGEKGKVLSELQAIPVNDPGMIKDLLKQINK